MKKLPPRNQATGSIRYVWFRNTQKRLTGQKMMVSGVNGLEFKTDSIRQTTVASSSKVKVWTPTVRTNNFFIDFTAASQRPPKCGALGGLKCQLHGRRELLGIELSNLRRIGGAALTHLQNSYHSLNKYPSVSHAEQRIYQTQPRRRE